MYLGIDIGTSAVKAVITDDAGSVASVAKVALDSAHPHAKWSEQNPADWWAATERCIHALDPAARRKVRAIGMAGQMHGAVLLDAGDRVLRPAILWNDGRAAAECAEFERREPRSRAITGNVAMPGFTAPKILWVAREEPDLFDRIAHVLLPKDYVRLRMTGVRATDLSDASGTLWLDVAARRWSAELLAASGLDLRQMPALHEGDAVAGVLRAEVASAWGMDRVPVAAGGGDNAAGAVGVGVVDPGDALLSLGTSGVIFAVTDAHRPNVDGAIHAFSHCLPGRWHQMSVMLSASACLEWIARITGFDGVAAMLVALEAARPIPSRELFLPYLSGERTPHNDPAAQAALAALSTTTDRLALVQAVLEGVAMGLADGLRALRDAGTAPARLSVIGGGARSPYWGRLLASALGIPLDYRAGGEVGPSYGAARLARLCLGEGDAAEVLSRPSLTATIDPDPLFAGHFAVQQPRFRALYESLKPLTQGPSA